MNADKPAVLPLVSTVTPAEQVAWDAWASRNHHRYGSAQFNAFLAGMRTERITSPSWVTLTPAQQLEHIEACDVCIFCEAGRAWGRCATCGDTKEALPPLGLSRCCGSRVAFGGEAA